MNASTIASLISVMAVLITGAGTILTSINSKRSADERKAERQRIEAEREVQLAQRDKLKEEASEIAMRRMSTELERVRKELEDAYGDVEKNRDARRGLEGRVDEQEATIRMQARRIRVLEAWIQDNANRLGIEGLPADLSHDRDDDETQPQRS